MVDTFAGVHRTTSLDRQAVSAHPTLRGGEGYTIV